MAIDEALRIGKMMSIRCYIERYIISLKLHVYIYIYIRSDNYWLSEKALSSVEDKGSH